MKNYMKNTAKMLVVGLGEVFSIKYDEGVYNCYFRFTENGLERSPDGVNNWDSARTSYYHNLLTGSEVIVKYWKPKIDDEYYIPSLAFYPDKRYTPLIWDGGDVDHFYLTNGLVCKTKEEAINMTGKLLAFAKNHMLFYEVSD